METGLNQIVTLPLTRIRIDAPEGDGNVIARLQAVIAKIKNKN